MISSSHSGIAPIADALPAEKLLDATISMHVLHNVRAIVTETPCLGLGVWAFISWVHWSAHQVSGPSSQASWTRRGSLYQGRVFCIYSLRLDRGVVMVPGVQKCWSSRWQHHLSLHLALSHRLALVKSRAGWCRHWWPGRKVSLLLAHPASCLLQ